MRLPLRQFDRTAAAVAAAAPPVRTACPQAASPGRLQAYGSPLHLCNRRLADGAHRLAQVVHRLPAREDPAPQPPRVPARDRWRNQVLRLFALRPSCRKTSDRSIRRKRLEGIPASVRKREQGVALGGRTTTAASQQV